MKVLLDTNALIWWMEDDRLLGPKARAVLANPRNIILATIVSIWEITIKWRIGKHPAPGSVYADHLSSEGVDLLGIEAQHVAAVERLAVHHKDPFDHLILAQAKVEGARIVTSDREMTRYGIPCIAALR